MLVIFSFVQILENILNCSSVLRMFGCEDFSKIIVLLLLELKERSIYESLRTKKAAIIRKCIYERLFLS